MKNNYENGGGSQQPPQQRGEAPRQKVSHKKDFWDNVADDVAKGYGARDAAKNFRNRDQEPNDNRRGDEVD